MKRSRIHDRRGFTLMEALTAAAILAMAVIGITVPFVAGAGSERDDAKRTLSNALAQELMEEILSKTFNDAGNGPEPGETQRSLYNCINDYDGYVETAGNITDVNGQVIDDPAAVGLWRHAGVTYVYVSGQDQSKPPTFASIVVEMRYQGQPVLKLTRLLYEI